MGIRQAHMRVIPIVALLSVVLFKFQNCAPADPAALATTSTGGGGVRVVDRWKSENLEFMGDTQLVPKTSSDIQIHGLCVGAQNHERIFFEIISLSNSPSVIDLGETECILGGFQVAVSSIALKQCDDVLRLRASRSDNFDPVVETDIRLDCTN